MESDNIKHTGRRSGIAVMAGLIGLVKPLIGIMLIAVVMGSIGNLMATFITVLGSMGIVSVLGFSEIFTLKEIFILMAIFAAMRGIMRYLEQLSNHYIAFKLLAGIRHKVFASLRKLAPAKLDGKEKGNLISVITSDIELLEVFYAHTVSPVAIAILTSLVMVLYIGSVHILLGIISLTFYLLVGGVIPVINSAKGQEDGKKYRDSYGELNTTVLDNLYGIDEILQYQISKKRKEKTGKYTEELEKIGRVLKGRELIQQIGTDTVILSAGIIMVTVAGIMASNRLISTDGAIVATVSLMSSFGPVAALSALSNNLNRTFASGNRVLDLLHEKPMIEDISDGAEVERGDIELRNVCFGYADYKGDGDKPEILKDFSVRVPENTIYGIHGESGSGKSTILKLLMRFYETYKGEIFFGNVNVNEIKTESLRKHISYVTQETFLFADTIENNIKIAKEDATREEIIEASKKASLHEFVMSLPKGYDTMLAELGDSVSGGERQRIGIARAFLHEAPVIFLDEPTSNIDSLNEGMVLKSLLEEKEGKTIVLVSHRASTMSVADGILYM